MATWGPIQLRLKGSRQVEFDGEASPAPGGGAMPSYAFYNNAGSGTDIGNTGSAGLQVDTKLSGDDILDPDTGYTLFIDGGVYLVSVNVDVLDTPLTAGGFISITSAADSQPGVTSQARTSLHPGQGETLTYLMLASPGDQFYVNVNNFDGAATRTFRIAVASIVKLRDL